MLVNNPRWKHKEWFETVAEQQQHPFPVRCPKRKRLRSIVEGEPAEKWSTFWARAMVATPFIGYGEIAAQRRIGKGAFGPAVREGKDSFLFREPNQTSQQ
ncbi:hypothetical protein GWI33_001979 [Rhynchophorus ferrugineus]|uniref:Uncharacterized protein n=1 Tax=Rhynchophorus ferrugineus TaxID=354439 RepID=A0A834IPU8_RHYFE|nr:hypothetical protein GWI33_001979 [Rhynchophorus ferrugineus]